MSEIGDYKTMLGFDFLLERENSLLKGIQDVQFYQTTNLDDKGKEIIDQVSQGLATINTNKLSEVEKNELIGKVKASNINSGDINGILNLVYGHIQSINFKTGSAGWRIDSNGNLEANSGTFRGTVSAATLLYGKTSFEDSTNAGYYISSLGVYVGAASNTTYLKYKTADGSFAFIGTISGRSTATLASAIDSSGDLITTKLDRKSVV